MAVKVTNRALRSHKWGAVKGHACRKEWTEQVTQYWPMRYSMPCMQYLVWSWVDHEGLALFIHGWLLKKTLLVVLSAILNQIPIHAFLSPVPIYCGGQSGTSWCCLAAAGGTPVPSTQLQETQHRFCIFSLISLIINVVSIISKAVFISNL